MRVSLENDSLMYAIMSEFCGGIAGFQAEPERRCVYLAQCFAPAVPPSRHERDMPESALALVHDFVPPGKIWITDFLGREWVTIDVAYYNQIPRIFNTLLGAGYRVLTHTPVKTEFKPGQTFDLRSFELHLIESVMLNVNMMDHIKDEQARWDYTRRMLQMRTLLKPYNWSTPEGRAFCAMLRARFRKDAVPKDRNGNRFGDARYVAACREHGILIAGPDPIGSAMPVADPVAVAPVIPLIAVAESVPKKVHVEREIQEEDDDDGICQVCMDKEADTLVLPCEHRVVCSACSIRLRATADNRICVRCRNPITHVAYADNELENK